MRVWDSVISRWFGGGDRAAVLRWCRSWKAGVCLVVLGLTVYLPGLFTIPPIDRDESRFAQASRQMFESAALPKDRQNPAFHSGGWVVPMVQDRARLNKPPLVYWLQVASAWLFTGGDPLKDAIWMYRVPGVLCALLTVLMTWRLGLSMFDPRAAVMGAALLAVCPLVVFDAHQARADQLLLTTVVGLQWGLWGVTSPTLKRGASTNPKRQRGTFFSFLTFWIFLGLSILAKGPIGPMIAVLTIVALCLATRSWRWIGALRPAIGLAIVVAMVAPWVWAVGEHVGWEKYLSIVKDETIGRSLEPKEGHWGPPGYHTVLLAVLFWPGSLTTAMAMGRAFKRGFPANPERQRRAAVASEEPSSTEPSQARGMIRRLLHASTNAARRLRDGVAGRSAELFLLAWIVPSWIVFELIGTKLPHYTVPMYPAVALVSARTFLSLSGSMSLEARAGAFRLGAMAWSLTGLVLSGGLTLVFAAVAIFWTMWTRTQASMSEILMPVSGWVGAAAAGCATVAAWRAIADARCEQWFIGMRRAATAAVACWVLFLVMLAPRVLPGAATVEIASAIEHAPGAAERPVGSVYHEDSLLFATRGRAVRLDAGQVQEWWNLRPNALLVLETKSELLRSESGAWQDGIATVPAHRSARLGFMPRRYCVVTRVSAPGSEK